jgi:hypothetical protein
MDGEGHKILVENQEGKQFSIRKGGGSSSASKKRKRRRSKQEGKST